MLKMESGYLNKSKQAKLRKTSILKSRSISVSQSPEAICANMLLLEHPLSFSFRYITALFAVCAHVHTACADVKVRG